MGADIIGWRGCPLQQELDVPGFLGKLKLRAYKSLVEDQIRDPAQRNAVQIQVEVTGRPARALNYPGICAELAAFEAGIPECATCPLAGGRPLGCYHYVTFPVDAVFERAAFDFFAATVETKDSICDQLYRDLVSRVVEQETAWASSRGGPGRLAELAQPLVHTWGGLFRKKRVSSAQILPCLFITLEHPALVVAYGRFWNELFEFVEQRDPGAMARSRTLTETAKLRPFMMSMLVVALDKGWVVHVDA